MKREYLYIAKLCLSGIVMALLTSCTESYDPTPIIEPVDDTTPVYQGMWSFKGKNLTEEYVWDMDSLLQMNLPIHELAEAYAPEGYKDAARENAYMLEGLFKLNRIGYSETSLYYQIPRPKYLFYTQYGGAVHKLSLFLSNSTAMKDISETEISVQLRVDSVQIDGITIQKYSPQEVLLFTCIKRVQ